MAQDLASLGIRVTTDGVKEAEQQLDSLAKTGAQTEQATKKLGPAVDSVGKAAGRTAPAIKQAAMSANELRGATRQLPMQITDIVTQLTAGQAPLQVLIQQGGQLKDTFGGIGPAVQASAGYIRGLINPYTLAAAAVVGLGIAWNKAESEAAGFERALILTGNQAGITAAQLEAMARSLDITTSATQGKASTVLAQVAATGQFTAEQIEMVAKAAIQMEEATGRAVEDTVKEFASLKGDPVDAILKLNDAMGDGANVIRFLTPATLEQIKALKDQGREAEATDVAMRALYDAIDERAPQAVQHMTTLQLVMKDLKEGAVEFGDAIVNAFRRAEISAGSLLKQMGTVAEATGPLAAAINRIGGVYAASLRARQSDNSSTPFVNVIDPRNPASMNIRPPSGNRGGIVDGENARARLEFERAGLRYLSDQEQKKRDIAEVQKLVTRGVIEQGEAEKRIAQINADYAERAKKGERKPRATSDRDSGESLLRQIREQIALTDVEFQQGEKITASDRLRAQMQTLLASEKSKVSAATREAIEASLAELEAAEQYKEIAEVNALIDAEAAEQQNALIQSRERHAESVAALLDEMQFELSLIGMSNEERVRAIALREAETRGLYDQTDAYVALAEKIYAAQEQEARLNDIKFAAEDMFASFIDGSKSAGEAFEDFAKSLQRIAARMLAEKAVQWLFNLFTNGGWGDSGGASGNNLFPSGWSSGGYTGPGGKHEPAGIVHRGEVVWSQDDVRRAGGVGVVESMRLRGYADGGVVGMYAPVPRGGGGGIRDIVINTPPGTTARTEEKPAGNGMKDMVIFIENTARNAIGKDLASGQGIAKIGQMNYGWRRQGVDRG
mgnify:FL=1